MNQYSAMVTMQRPRKANRIPNSLASEVIGVYGMTLTSSGLTWTSEPAMAIRKTRFEVMKMDIYQVAQLNVRDSFLA
jgi:hypothetical protein